MAIGAILGQTFNAGNGIDINARDISIKLSEQEGNGLKFDETGALLGGAGKRTCRFVIGTSTAGWTQEDCDYLCDGTDDQVEINAAIQALPSGGGEIVILDGTYNLSAPITPNKYNVSIKGSGISTCLRRSSGEKTSKENSAGIAIKNNSNYAQISDLSVTSESGYRGIYITGEHVNITTVFFSKGNYCLVTDTGAKYVSVVNCSLDDVSNSCQINNCDGFLCNNNNFYDSAITSDSSKNVVISNNAFDKASFGAISISSTLGNFDIIGNTFSNSEYGPVIDLRVFHNYKDVSSVNIVGNIFNNNSGESVIGINGSNCLISGNILKETFTSSYKSITLESDSANNLVIGNVCIGGAPVDSGSNNTLVNNKY